jgi:hypothetical protein
MNQDFLREDSKLSSMRWALVQVTRMGWLLICSGVFTIIFNTIKNRPVDWVGILALVGGVTALIGAGVTGKWLQKKQEVK